MEKEKPNTAVATIYIVVLILVLTLNGCSTYQYKRAEAPDSATVQFVNKSITPVSVRESHRGDCTDSWSFNNDGSSIPPNASRSTPVLPGTFFVIMPTGQGNATHHKTTGGGKFYLCIISVGFTVEANGFYEITYIDEERGCALKARWKKDEDWQSLHLTKMKPKNLFTNPVSCEIAKD
jgi:hypothetical protein